jgi:hypothetical protein
VVLGTRVTDFYDRIPEYEVMLQGLMIAGVFALLCCQACLLLNVRFATALDTRSYKLYYNDVLAQHARKGINTIITHP